MTAGRKALFNQAASCSTMGPTAGELVDAIRGHLLRGVRHENLGGRRLTTVREVLETLIVDGFVVVRPAAAGGELH